MGWLLALFMALSAKKMTKLHGKKHSKQSAYPSSASKVDVNLKLEETKGNLLTNMKNLPVDLLDTESGSNCESRLSDFLMVLQQHHLVLS